MLERLLWISPAGSPEFCRHACNFVLSPAIYRMTGGALLLGLNGTGIIAHGRSDALAIEKAVEVAAKYAEKGVSKNVNERLAAIKDEPAEAK